MEAIIGLVGALLASLGINILQAKRNGRLKAENRRLEVDREKHTRKQGIDPGIAVGDDAFLDSMREPVEHP